LKGIRNKNRLPGAKKRMIGRKGNRAKSSGSKNLQKEPTRPSKHTGKKKGKNPSSKVKRTLQAVQNNPEEPRWWFGNEQGEGGERKGREGLGCNAAGTWRKTKKPHVKKFL